MKAPQTEPNGRNYRPIHQFNDFIESLLEPQKRRAPNTFRIRALPASQSCRCLCRLPVSQGVELHLLFAPATPDIPQKGQALNPGPRKNQIKPNERVKCRWLAGKEAEINPIETQVLPQCSMKCRMPYTVSTDPIRSDFIWFNSRDPTSGEEPQCQPAMFGLLNQMRPNQIIC